MAHGQQTLTASNPAPSSDPASLHGTVVNADGALCQGVQIALTRPGQAVQAPSIQISDSNGSFAFTGIAPGPFKLTFTSVGFAIKTLEGTLAPGEDDDVHSVTLTLERVE